MSDSSDLERHEQFVQEIVALNDKSAMRPIAVSQLIDIMMPGAEIYLESIGNFVFHGRWHNA